MADFFTIGEACDKLETERARHTLAVCRSDHEFKVNELRQWKLPTTGLAADVIVVDCISDQVPSRNAVGIRVRERLALIFPHDGNAPEVRALRKNFPIVPHLNHTDSNEPSSLCIYIAPWSATERTWTAQSHLRAIQWWLAESAKGTLHRSDQPLERIYFNATHELVLPPDFERKLSDPKTVLTLEGITRPKGIPQVIRADFKPPAEVKHKGGDSAVVPLPITLSPVMHGRIERYPDSLGMAHDQLEARGVPFREKLIAAVRSKVDERGIMPIPKQTCLLILTLPITRSAGASPEETDVRGLMIMADLATLGDALGILHKTQGRYFAVSIIGSGITHNLTDAWRTIKVSPVDIRSAITKEFARFASGVDQKTASFQGVLGGVGALGSAMLDRWTRAGWGEWTVIDPDVISAHNVVRHVALDPHIGWMKVAVAQQIAQSVYYEKYSMVSAIPENVLDVGNKSIQETLATTSLFVDATTTLEVPRDLSQRSDVPRSCSVFITPSGSDSALILEDADRELRLEALEAQYYRAIINSPWGSNHLEGNKGNLWVGAGCRDISLVMSNELVQLHASTLARQVRQLRDQPAAKIRVWQRDDASGAVSAYDVTPFGLAHYPCKTGWHVVCDLGVEYKLKEMRHQHLPSETGGVIVGYIDQKLHKIYVVDVLPAPPDSDASPAGFTRGIEGLEQALVEIGRRTANIVEYIGEWHSHPPFSSASPSRDDRLLIQKLADALVEDGKPALMMIAGAEEFCTVVE